MKDKKEIIVGKIVYKIRKEFKNFLGLGFDKHGCVIFIYDKNQNKIVNKSIRPIYIAFEDNKYYYYFKIQDVNQNLSISYSFPLKEAKNGLPNKPCAIIYDNLHRINKGDLESIIDKNHQLFLETNNFSFQKQKEILINFYNNFLINTNQNQKLEKINVKDLTIVEIEWNKLFQEINDKKDFHNIQVANIIHTTINVLNNENNLNENDKNCRTIHKNHLTIIELIKRNRINKIEDLEHIIKTVENHLKFLDQKIKEESKQKTFNTAVFYFKNNKSRGFDKVLNSLEPNEQKELWGIIKQTDKWKEMFKQFKIQKCIEFYEKNDEWFLKIFDTLTPKEKEEFENKLLEKEKKKKDEEKIKAKEKYNDEGREK